MTRILLRSLMLNKGNKLKVWCQVFCNREAFCILKFPLAMLLKFAGLQTGLRFSPAAFFYGLLPPIVFAAGFTLKKRDFFRNFGTISVFAVPGTFISALFFGSITYALVAIGVVKRSHLGTAPLIECLLYGKSRIAEALFAQHSFTSARTSHAPIIVHSYIAELHLD